MEARLLLIEGVILCNVAEKLRLHSSYAENTPGFGDAVDHLRDAIMEEGAFLIETEAYWICLPQHEERVVELDLERGGMFLMHRLAETEARVTGRDSRQRLISVAGKLQGVLVGDGDVHLVEEGG